MLLRIITYNLTFHNLKNVNIFRNPSLIRNFVRENFTKVGKSEKSYLNYPLSLAFGLGTSVLLKNHFTKVFCDANRTTDIKIVTHPELNFDWKRLWYYLKRHTWKLLGAIAAALIVAYFNINIPSLLGELVNALSKYAGPEHGTTKDFLKARILLYLVLSASYQTIELLFF